MSRRRSQRPKKGKPKADDEDEESVNVARLTDANQDLAASMKRLLAEMELLKGQVRVQERWRMDAANEESTERGRWQGQDHSHRGGFNGRSGLDSAIIAVHQ